MELNLLRFYMRAYRLRWAICVLLRLVMVFMLDVLGRSPETFTMRVAAFDSPAISKYPLSCTANYYV